MGLELNDEGTAWVPINQPSRRMIRPPNHSRQRPPPQPMSPTHQDMVMRLPPGNSRYVPKNPTTSTLQIVLIVAFVSFVVIGIVVYLILWAFFSLLAWAGIGTGGWS